MSLRVRGARPGDRASVLAAAVAAAVAFLPFLRGVAAGHVLYFRDLAVLFHPYRQYAAEGLRAGQARFWDPYVHEGVPLVYPPVGYPLDLLQALWSGPSAVSLLLALHVPLAAVAFVILARRLGLSPLASVTGALVYALGGFVLSTVNLYVYVQAAAWAPMVVLGFRAAGVRRRAIAGAAVATALTLASLGVEVALQAMAVGLVLAWRPRRSMSLVRGLAAAALGIGLAAPVILVMRANMAAGQRAHGFPIDVVLNQSVHPFTLVQVLVANLYGELSRLPDRWWGSNFFDRGFPYILSLYLGATVLALAVTGAYVDPRRTRRVVALAALALIVSLGRWGGLGTMLSALPESWRVFRYPTKAYFTVHLCMALLAAAGLQAVSRRRGAQRVFVVCAFVLGALLGLVPVLPRLFPAAAAWFVAHFFPPAVPAATRAEYFGVLLADAARGGQLAIAAALVCGLAILRRIDARLAAALVASVAVGDLLRAGVGLNPMAEPSFLRTAPEVLSVLHGLPRLQRVFTCRPEASRAYWRARALRPQAHETLTFAAWADTLTPNLNRPAHVLSALGEDLTSLVPLDRLLPPGAGCGDVERLVPWLRSAGVSHVLSLDPIAGPGLQPVVEIAVARLAPLHVFVAAVSEPLPLRFVATSVRPGTAPTGAVGSPDAVWVEGAPEDVDGAQGSIRSLLDEPDHIELEVAATRATALIVLDGSSPGWRAAVDGNPAPMLRAGHHRAVRVPAGTSRVEMDYRPPGLRAGVALSALSLAVAAAASVPVRRRRRQAGGSEG